MTKNFSFLVLTNDYDLTDWRHFLSTNFSSDLMVHLASDEAPKMWYCECQKETA